MGPDSAERARKAEELAAEHGYVPVPPYDDEILMAGQGTVGAEIFEDLPDVESVLVPVSGGGLISGVSAAIKLDRPEMRVIGVEPELAADARESLKSGRLVEFPAEQVSRTIADGLRVQRLGEAPFEHVRAFVDDIVTVTEEEILDAMRRLAFRVRLVAEPSGAVTFAAHLFHREELPDSRLTVAVISGGNVEPDLLAEVISGSDSAVALQQSAKIKKLKADSDRLTARRGLDGVSDAHGAQGVVDQVAPEKDLPVGLAVGRERTQGLFAAGAGLLVRRRNSASRAGFGDPERDASDPEPAPAVFGVGVAAPDDEVGPEAVHGKRVFQALFRSSSEASEIRRNAKPSAKPTWSPSSA